MAEVVVGHHIPALDPRDIHQLHVNGQRSQTSFRSFLVDEVDHLRFFRR